MKLDCRLVLDQIPEQVNNYTELGPFCDLKGVVYFLNILKPLLASKNEGNCGNYC